MGQILFRYISLRLGGGNVLYWLAYNNWSDILFLSSILKMFNYIKREIIYFSASMQCFFLLTLRHRQGLNSWSSVYETDALPLGHCADCIYNDEV